MNKEESLRSIRYINVPEGMRVESDIFRLDKNIMLPVQLKTGESRLKAEDITLESITAGMLTVIAYDENHKDASYYKDFVLTIDPTLPDKLMKAAIAKEEQKDYEFSEELFLAVYHLMPQSASCINLATLYSYMAVDARDKGNEEKEDEYLLSAKHTLKDGLRRFGEDAEVLAELSSYEAFTGNLEEAKDYLDRYMAVAEEGEKKQEMKKLLSRIEVQLENDEEIKEAYDFIMLDDTDKAIKAATKFIENNKDVWNGYFLRGWALRKAGKFEEARKDQMKCLELGERNADIYNELSIDELEVGDRELAKTYLETAADLDPENLTIVSNLSYLYLQDDQYDEAREYLEKARFLSGNDEIVKNLIKEYEKKTGEKIGELIHEEIVHDDSQEKEDEDDDAYAAEIAEIEKDDCDCHCHHHHHEEE